MIEADGQYQTAPSVESVFGLLPSQPILDEQSYSTANSLEEMVNAASAFASRNARTAAGGGIDRQNAAGETAGAPPQSAGRGQGYTLEDVARSLVNSQGAAPPGIGTPRADNGTDGISVLASVMRIELSPDVIQAIARVTSPRLNLGGIVTFSVFGMGDFAITKVASPGLFEVVDVAKNTGASMADGIRRDNADSAFYSDGQHGSHIRSAEMSDKIAEALEWLDEILNHPLFILALAVLGFCLLIWAMWRLQFRKKSSNRSSDSQRSGTQRPIRKRARRRRVHAA